MLPTRPIVQRRRGAHLYVYDSAGQRVRKVTGSSRQATIKDERIYLGGFEIYRRHDTLRRADVALERETLHVMDDKQRIALVETRTLTGGQRPGADGSSSATSSATTSARPASSWTIEAQIISYEEYTPYGSIAYQAVRSRTETPKRYRYTGKGAG